MKAALTKGAPLSWFLILAIACGAAIVLWKVIVLDAPPSNALLITSQADETISAVVLTPTTKASSAKSTKPTSTPASLAQTAATAEPTTIQVYVTGAVRKPGVYTLSFGARVADALEAAGGATSEADLQSVNLAKRVADEEQIAIPATEPPVAAEPTPENAPIEAAVAETTAVEDTPVSAASVESTPNGSTPSTATPQRNTPTPKKATPTAKPPTPVPAKTPTAALTGKININTATEQELEQIPGIGPALAGRIIEYRQQNGPFATIEDLMQIPGIKSGIMGKVRPYVTVGP